jgi:hypothetical protein
VPGGHGEALPIRTGVDLWRRPWGFWKAVRLPWPRPRLPQGRVQGKVVLSTLGRRKRAHSWCDLLWSAGTLWPVPNWLSLGTWGLGPLTPSSSSLGLPGRPSPVCLEQPGPRLRLSLVNPGMLETAQVRP